MNRVKYTLCFLSLIVFIGCLFNCNKDVSGRYYANKGKVINYLEIKDNGEFLHYYSENGTVLTHKGKWNMSNEGYCALEFDGWKNFEGQGLDYIELGNQILFIQGDHLNHTPDGETLSSFKKE